jgi:MarR family transcriptional regulator, 2-MHQ and catechol-resistance regulon repressor
MKDLKTITILFRCVDTFQSEISSSVNEMGLSLTSFMALEALYHKGPLNVAQLQSKVLIANSSLSYVIEQLALKDLIHIENDLDDRRRKVCSLTSKGKQIMSEVYPKHVIDQRIRLDRLTQDEELQLQGLLKKIGLD